MMSTNTGSPATMMAASITLVVNMKMMMNTMFMISKSMLMMPLDSISDTEFT